MNTLSWFLYFAGIATELSGFFAGMGLLFGMAGIMTYFATHPATPPKTVRLIAGGFFLLMTLSWAASALIPKKDTLYAIAASEMGEEALKSRLGQKSLQAIEAWVDKQISPK